MLPRSQPTAEKGISGNGGCVALEFGVKGKARG